MRYTTDTPGTRVYGWGGVVAVHSVAAHVQQLCARVHHAVQNVQHRCGAVCGGVAVALHASRLRVCPSGCSRVERKHVPDGTGSAKGHFTVFVHKHGVCARVATGSVHWAGVLGAKHSDVAEPRATVYTRIRRHSAKVRLWCAQWHTRHRLHDNVHGRGLAGLRVTKPPESGFADTRALFPAGSEVDAVHDHQQLLRHHLCTAVHAGVNTVLFATVGLPISTWRRCHTLESMLALNAVHKKVGCTPDSISLSLTFTSA
jgi:hypothetical protein